MEKYVSLPLIRIGEAARCLGVGRRVIYRLIETKEIRAVRVGRGVRIELAGVEALKARRVLS
jgi:excisionase family DNA binding protein